MATRGTADRPGPERLLTFVDAVVAIALTLLVLPLVDLVPEAVRAHEAAADIVRDNLPAFGSFLLSFAVIARFWLAHHELSRFARTASGSLVRWNMLWLLTVVLLPFVTQLVGSYPARGLVAQTYVGLLLVAAVCTAAMVLEIRRVDAPTSAAWPRLVRATLENLGLQAVAFVAVLAAPSLGYWPLVLLALQDVVDAVFQRRRGPRETTA